MAEDNTLLRLDVSHAERLIKKLRNDLSEEQFHKVMRRAMIRSGRNVRTMVGREVRQDYRVSQGYVTGSIGMPKVSLAGGEVNCMLPVANARGGIGTVGVYAASGGRPGHRGAGGRRVGGKPVSARIVTSGNSILPSSGERIFFRSKRGKAYWRLSSDKRLPIHGAVGIAVPQMPLNRSRDKVQDRALEILEKRLIHECNAMLNGIVQ